MIAKCKVLAATLVICIAKLREEISRGWNVNKVKIIEGVMISEED